MSHRPTNSRLTKCKLRKPLEIPELEALSKRMSQDEEKEESLIPFAISKWCCLHSTQPFPALLYYL